jgi:predicted GNAT family N-acyltransferase
MADFPDPPLTPTLSPAYGGEGVGLLFSHRRSTSTPGTDMSQITAAASRRFTVRRATAGELIDLRWRILRAGLPREEALFPGDNSPDTFHFAAVDDDARVVISCATFRLASWDDEPAYQLRGMATSEACRGLGLGRSLLALAEADISGETPIRLLWCNARTPAIDFYRKLGWEVRSEQFDIPTAGPHVRMTKQL